MGTAAGGSALRQYLLIRLERHTCALPVEAVLEIRSVPPLPRRRPGGVVVGSLEVRGRAVSILDLRALLGLPAWKPRRDASVLLVRRGENRYGLLVDMVDEITDIPDAEIGSGGAADIEPHYVRGTVPRSAPITVLDAGAILAACGRVG